MDNQAKMEKVGECPTCGAPIYAPEWNKRGAPPTNLYTCGCRLNVQPSFHYHYPVPQYIPYIPPLTLPMQPMYEPVWCGGSGCGCKAGG